MHLPTAAGRPLAPVHAAGAAAAVALPLLVLVNVSRMGTILVLLGALGGLALFAVHRWLLSWPVVIGAIVLVILFIPIRRYTLPASLPFELEPYRLAVALVVVAWMGSLLVEPATRLRRTGLEGPLSLFVVALGLSVAFNVPRIGALGVEQEVIKKLTFFASFLFVLYLTAGVLARRFERDRVLAVLVAGGAVVAACGIVEARTGFNPFDHLGRALPFLQQTAEVLADRIGERGGRLRAYASAQHSIALGAALAMLFPFAVYLAYRRRARVWWLCVILLGLGALSTVSRTAALMLVVEGIVLFILKPAQVRRLWPLAIPFLLVVHIAMPGTIGAFKASFFPDGGLVAEQQKGEGTYGSGRIADLGPGLSEWSSNPVFGQGFGTRVTVRTDPKWNAAILDNQWLGLLLETGVLGVFAMGWILIRAVRRLGRRARREDSDHGWLMAAFAASIAAFGVGMFTYDTFSFIQVTFLLFILLGLAAPETRMLLPRPWSAPLSPLAPPLAPGPSRACTAPPLPSHAGRS